MAPTTLHGSGILVSEILKTVMECMGVDPKPSSRHARPTTSIHQVQGSEVKNAY